MVDSPRRAAALLDLTSRCAAASRPALDAAVLSAILDDYRVADADGLRPTDTGWTETWDLNLAAAEAWRRKAGLVAGDFSFSADDARYDKGAVLANMEKMVALWLAKSNGVLVVAGAERPYDTDRLRPNG
jgi:hypothetical protein